MNNNEVITLLRDPETIRNRAKIILNKAYENELQYFQIHPKKMAETAAFVTEVILDNYPDLQIPYHSRWRHFEAGKIDRIKQMNLETCSAEERGKILYELVIISVLLDAGAGANWRYLEETSSMEFTRSEGLALASLHLYLNGHFSAHPREHLRVDARRLSEFSEDDIKQGFQVYEKNPLEGIAGRVALLNRLGKTIEQNQCYFGEDGRLGDFFTYVSSLKKNGCIEAREIFQAVLDGFNDIWPTRLSYEGIALGDVWRHSALKSKALDSEFMPFHKLSQWLTYSLIEPLEQAGINVIHMDALTGLPEYRNGGLLIDTGLLSLKNPDDLNKAHDPGSSQNGIPTQWSQTIQAVIDKARNK